MKLFDGLLIRCVKPGQLVVGFCTAGIIRSLDRLQRHSNPELAEKAKQLLRSAGKLLQVCPYQLNSKGKRLHLVLFPHDEMCMYVLLKHVFKLIWPDRCGGMFLNPCMP